MELKGKTAVFLGDSITEGVGVTDIAANRYDNALVKNAEMKRCYNYGVGGSRIAYQTKPSEWARSDLYFCGRAFDMEKAVDLVVVFGGTNDYGHGDAPLGSMTDTKPYTFCGAVDYLMTTLQQLYPNAWIVFLTPCRAEGDLAPTQYPPTKGRPMVLKDFVDVILKKGEQHSIPVLDLYTRMDIDPNRPEDKERYAPDGLHLNDEGHRVLAGLLESFLRSL